VGLLFVAEFLLVNALLLRSFGDFMRLTQPQTPLMALMAVMLVLAERTGRLGLEVLARANDVLLPVLMAAGLAVTLTVSHEKHAYHLLPVLERGWPPVLAGALALQGLFAEAVVLGMFSPLVTGGRRPLRHALWLVVVLAALFAGPITGPTALFGLHSVRAMFYPTWEEVKHIQLAGITANLDVLGVLLWTLGTFVKATVLLWSSSAGLASLTGLRDSRAVMAPVAVITAGLAVLVGENSTRIVAFLTGIYPLVSIAVGIGLPLVLLLVSLLYRRTWRPPSAPDS
jgi:spore germination protein KB